MKPNRDLQQNNQHNFGNITTMQYLEGNGEVLYLVQRVKNSKYADFSYQNVFLNL